MQVIRQAVQIKLDEEELATLRQASVLLGEICGTYRDNAEDCEGCPLNGVCSIEHGAPQDVVFYAYEAMKG